MSTRLTVLVAALALAASPALAQSNTDTTPNAGNPGTPATNNMSGGPGMNAGSSHMRHHRSHMASEHTRSHRGTRGGSGTPSAADHSADQLNAQVLSNIQSGQGAAPPSGGMSSGGAMGTSGGSGPMRQ
ncbi:MAG: hypothetical protein J0H14_12775 [Alphaproteobacteria bacterium]|nr:hypothetical protein [Alphaproteobacteria bacterium]